MTDLAAIREWLEQTSEPRIGEAVRALLDEVERLREENEWLEDEADGYMCAESYTAWERDEAEAEVERLRSEVNDLKEERAKSTGKYQWMFMCSMCGDSEYTSHYFEHEGKPVCSHCKVKALEG